MTTGTRRGFLRRLTRSVGISRAAGQAEATQPVTAPSWTQLRTARRQGDDVLARETLKQLCQVYSSPVYAFLRQKGYDTSESARLTSRFFQYLLERDSLRRIDPERPRFREWLRTMLGEFLKDGPAPAELSGEPPSVSSSEFDPEEAERSYQVDLPAMREREGHVFERAWAVALLARAQARLADECAAAGKAELYAALKGHLEREPMHADFRSLSASTGVHTGSLKVHVARFRTRIQVLVLDEIAESLGVERESNHVLKEMAFLRSALAANRS